MFLLSKFLSVFKSEFRLCRFAFQRWMQDEERVYPHGASKSGLKPASPDAAGRPLSVLKCSFFGRLEAKWSWWVPCSHVYIAVRDKNVGKRIFFFFFVSQSAILNRISGNKTWPIFRRQNQIRTYLLSVFHEKGNGGQLSKGENHTSSPCCMWTWTWPGEGDEGNLGMSWATRQAGFSFPSPLSFWTSCTLVNLEFPAQRQKTASTVGFSPNMILAGWKPKKQCIQFHQRAHNLKCCDWARLGTRKIVKNKPSAVNARLSEAIHNDVSTFLNGEVD